MSNIISGNQLSASHNLGTMQTISLFDLYGRRKYLTPSERRAFAITATKFALPIQTFCHTLTFTGARISEALALTPERLDGENEFVVLETLKRRKRGIFRGIPVPDSLLRTIAKMPRVSTRSERDPSLNKIWSWGRTTAWKYVKEVLIASGVSPRLATPKAIRHAFAIDALQCGMPLNLVQRWMGHARIETTAIYADAVGSEERNIAQRMWTGFPAL
jgi:integrase